MACGKSERMIYLTTIFESTCPKSMTKEAFKAYPMSSFKRERAANRAPGYGGRGRTSVTMPPINLYGTRTIGFAKPPKSSGFRVTMTRPWLSALARMMQSGSLGLFAPVGSEWPPRSSAARRMISGVVCRMTMPASAKSWSNTAIFSGVSRQVASIQQMALMAASSYPASSMVACRIPSRWSIRMFESKRTIAIRHAILPDRQAHPSACSARLPRGHYSA